MVKEGDILTEPCDAIVNSSNDKLDLSKGVVSQAISKACGSDLLVECKKQRDQMMETGVVVTPVPEGLGCGSVIHVSADRFKGDWTKGILAVLHTADQENITSLAMPALGTGVRGADAGEVARAMQRAVAEFGAGAPRCVREVRVLVFQRHLMQPYIAAFSPTAAPPMSRPADSAEASSHGPRERNQEQVDVLVFALEQSAIKVAREKIHSHIQSMVVSKSETNPLISSFSSKQKEDVFKLQAKHSVAITLDTKKGAVTFNGVELGVANAVIDLKDIIMSASTKRHLAAGGPPVRWQYQTGKDKFTEFDPESTLSIEAAFKSKEPNVTFTDSRQRRYKIVFKDRKEYSLDDKAAAPVTVKRRDILDEKKREMPLPSHWDPMKGDKVKQVQLKSDCAEYKKVSQHFGAQQASIKKIERIQNPWLFRQFKVKKNELEQHNPKGTENEKRLFHGTSSDSIKAIINNGFDRSYCGKNGTALGAGVYFAADSSYSMGYAANGGQMFQVRVLVGEYTQGNGSMKHAPMKPSADRPYDSVGNAPTNASVFVIFHDCQAYPEYLISF